MYQKAPNVLPHDYFIIEGSIINTNKNIIIPAYTNNKVSKNFRSDKNGQIALIPFNCNLIKNGLDLQSIPKNICFIDDINSEVLSSNLFVLVFSLK